MIDPPLLEKQYYRQAETQTGFFGRTFKLRFPQMQNSLLTMGILKRIFCILHWKLFHKKQPIPENNQLQRLLPMTKPNFQVQQGQIKYTWIGHSTAVISFGKDCNFIIDPVFSKRCSPFEYFGPKRYRPPACQINQLPQIDVVLVSHDHYDHHDTEALNKLYKKSLTENNNMRFFSGLQSRDIFPKNSQTITLNWTQSKEIMIRDKKFKITFVPACHWGRRGLFDQNKRLWGGFIVQTPNHQKVFYSGDTGYCGVFKQLGEIFQQFDLAILPIGAYKPRQYLKNQHVDPQQAVKIHKQLNSKKSVGVHWGTFPLGNQNCVSTRQDLQKAKIKYGLRDQQFIAIGHGQSFSIEYKEEVLKMMMSD